MKGLAITGLVLAILSIIVPLYGIRDMPTIAALIALACAFSRHSTLAITTVGINLINIFFFSYSFKLVPEAVTLIKTFHLVISGLVVLVVLIQHHRPKKISN